MPHLSYSAIWDVGETLRNLLQMAMDDTFTEDANKVTVKLEPPKKIEETDKQNILTVFLYKIVENADLKNHPPAAQNFEKVRKQPFDLHFMLTPNSNDERNMLRMLGRAVQALLDKSILLGADLQGSYLEGTAEQLRVSMSPVSQEIITQIWQALESPMRISVFYLVTPVFIVSEPLPEAGLVLERETSAP